MGIERRRAERVRVNLDVVFADQLQQYKGTISDISVTGCFILSAGKATPKELITVTIELPSKKSVTLKGEVVYNNPEIGFAIQFIDLPDASFRFIEKLVKRLGTGQIFPGQVAG